MKNDEQILHSIEDIENHILNYYMKLFAFDNRYQNYDIIGKVIPNLVTVEDNAMFTNLPFMDEVKNAVLSLNVDGAPGPDDFGGFFD